MNIINLATVVVMLGIVGIASSAQVYYSFERGSLERWKNTMTSATEPTEYDSSNAQAKSPGNSGSYCALPLPSATLRILR